MLGGRTLRARAFGQALAGFGVFFLGIDGIVYLVGAVILGGWFLWASIRSALSKSNQSAKALLLVSVIYLPLLFILMVADKR